MKGTNSASAVLPSRRTAPSIRLQMDLLGMKPVSDISKASNTDAAIQTTVTGRNRTALIGLTFDVRGGHKRAQPACGRPLDGGVRRLVDEKTHGLTVPAEPRIVAS